MTDFWELLQILNALAIPILLFTISSWLKDISIKLGHIREDVSTIEIEARMEINRRTK